MRKLAIVGSHVDTRTLAPYQDESFDIWVFNEAAQNDWCKRWTACFQLHKPEIYQSLTNVNHRGHWDWLQQDHGKRTIYMQDYDEFVPNSRRYPMDEILATFPAAQPLPGSTFITSTAVMALALALYEGYEYIEVYGVDLNSNTEYASQQACWLYWVGVAKAILGTNLVILSGEHLYRARVYGYEGEVQIERAYYQERVSFWEAEKKAAENKMFKCKSRLHQAVIDFKPDEFSDLIVEAQDVSLALGEIDGALDTARGYAGRNDPISAQQFEREGAQAQEDAAKAQGDADKKSGIVEYVWNTWKITRNPEAQKQLRMFYGQLLEASYTAGKQTGIMTENKKYMGEYNARATAAGGTRTLRSMGLME